MPNVVQYQMKRSNLPSSEDLYQPVVETVTVQSVEDVSAVIAQSLGYEANVVFNILDGLAGSLPHLLSLGVVDLGFMTLTLTMTGTTTDPNTSYTASNAPLQITSKLRKKSNMIAQVRPLITMQKNPYIPKVPVFNGLDATRYDMSMVPLSSTLVITGVGLGITGKTLVGFISTDPDFAGGDGTAYPFNDVPIATSSRLVVSIPYAMKAAVVQSAPAYAKIGINDAGTVTTTNIAKVVYGGTELIALIEDTDNSYTSGTDVTQFRFSMISDVLNVAVKSGIATSVWGPDVPVVDSTEITVLDNAATPNSQKYWVGAGAVDFYSGLAADAPYVVEGYWE